MAKQHYNFTSHEGRDEFYSNKSLFSNVSSFYSRQINAASTIKKFSTVSDFYAGKSVLITGGTGFVGKVFIEKLLYSCKDIEKVYVLVRPQKYAEPEKRIQDLINKPLFSRLKLERPEDLNKIVPVVGDIAAPNLGLSKGAENDLLDQVSVVFHSAATIKFNEPLKVALNINYEGTKRMLDLCRRMKNIEAFVHISTAYTNTHLKVIEEVVYPPPATVEKVYQFLDKHGDDEQKTKDFIRGAPNTYTFTKALAENLVKETHADQSVPSVIVRPSMVKASRSEPLPGWIDAWSIPTNILYTVGKGLNRVVIGEKDTIVDFIPVDYVANLSIVAATRCERSGELAVYNSATSVCNPITLRQSLKIYSAEARKHHFNELPYPWALTSKSRWLIDIFAFTMQTLPAHIADFWMVLTGKKPKFVKLNAKIVNLREKSQFFTGSTWYMTARRTQALAKSLSLEDQRKFPCDPGDIDWSEFMKTHYHGVSKFLCEHKIKEDS